MFDWSNFDQKLELGGIQADLLYLRALLNKRLKNCEKLVKKINLIVLAILCHSPAR